MAYRQPGDRVRIRPRAGKAFAHKVGEIVSHEGAGCIGSGLTSRS
jgi:hypothetical protein